MSRLEKYQAFFKEQVFTNQNNKPQAAIAKYEAAWG
jgi:hypothetical protein